MAMGEEANPIIQSLKLQEKSGQFKAGIPFKLYQGNKGTLQISLMVSGVDPVYQVDNVATVPAVLMSYIAVEQFKPEVIINAGTAGGISQKGCQIGDVYLSSGNFCFHDRRIAFPGYDKYGMGFYPAPDISAMAAALELKTGAISTGNSLDLLDVERDMIESNQCIIKDMEAAAIAWICQTLSMPMFAIKAITDLIDGETSTESQFTDNFKLATTQLQKKTTAVLQYLDAGGKI
jgi:5'-methylthioadenosine nucleosidase